MPLFGGGVAAVRGSRIAWLRQRAVCGEYSSAGAWGPGRPPAGREGPEEA